MSRRFEISQVPKMSSSEAYRLNLLFMRAHGAPRGKLTTLLPSCTAVAQGKQPRPIASTIVGVREE